MSLVTILWSMGAAAALTLAAVYGATWLFERRLLANLFFSISAIATALCARCELGMMHSATPAEFGEWVRWYHLPLFLVFLSQGLFVLSYLGAGRRRLFWTIMSMRAVYLAVNFSVSPNVFFREILSLHHVYFLGEEVSIVGEAVLRPWIWFGRTTLVLAVWFLTDAAVAAWRRGGADSRHKACIVLAAVLGPVLIEIPLTQLQLSGLISVPYFNTPNFLFTLGVMAFELSRDLLTSFRTRRELAELRANLVRVGRVSMMGQLASALAHEINQPLGAILRNTDVAELDLRNQQPDLEELRGIVADTGRAVRRAKEIIDRTRALIKWRSIDMRPLLVDDLVQDVISLARAEAASKDVTLSYSRDSALPMISGDRVHLSQVLLNLILNSVEAMQTASVVERRVVIEARTRVSQVELSVRDSGPGVLASDVDRIFEPLFSTKPEGLGMGLAICRTIIDAHGGRLWAERLPPGAGATFQLVLPQAR